MKRWILPLCCLLMALPLSGAMAMEPAPGHYAKQMEADALLQGKEVRTETTYAWEGLPLLGDDTNRMLRSLLSEMTTRYRVQRAGSGGYRVAEVSLQGAPVLDLAVQAADGLYYEQSSLLGGQTLAFTPAEFSRFVARVSARSGGALPADLDALFEVALRAIGTESIDVDRGTEADAAALLAGWKASALTVRDSLRPAVNLPGRYGVRAEIIDVTREEAIALAQAYASLLEENDALWAGAAKAQLPDGADADTIDETARRIADTMRGLPQLLTDALPVGLPPAEYREVFGADDQLIVRQLDVSLPDGGYLACEWAPREAGIPEAYVSLSLGDVRFALILTREDGVPAIHRQNASLRNRMIAQWTLEDATMRLDVVMTRTETVERTAEREVIQTRTEWMMESEALLGEGTVTLSSEARATTSGTIRDGYQRRTITEWRLKGLGVDKVFLSSNARTRLFDADPPVLTAEVTAVRPGQMGDAALIEWLDGTQVSLLQAAYTILGRLPSDVAGYLLERMAP